MNIALATSSPKFGWNSNELPIANGYWQLNGDSLPLQGHISEIVLDASRRKNSNDTIELRAVLPQIPDEAPLPKEPKTVLLKLLGIGPSVISQLTRARIYEWLYNSANSAERDRLPNVLSVDKDPYNQNAALIGLQYAE